MISDNSYEKICTELNKICTYYMGEPVSKSWKKDIYYRCYECGSLKFGANEEKRVAHCFHCGLSVNAIQVIQQVENLTVKEAIEKGIHILGLPIQAKKELPSKYTKIVCPSSKEELFTPIKHAIYMDIYNFYKTRNPKSIDYYANKFFGSTPLNRSIIDFVVSKKSLDVVNFLSERYPEEVIESCPGFYRIDGALKFSLSNHIIFPYWDPYRRYICAFNGRLKYNPPDGPRYKWLVGEKKYLFFPEYVTPSNFEVITEGEKKAITASLHGVNTIAVSGIDCFDTDDFKQMDLSGRDIFICYDRDKINPNVTRAELKLAAKLADKNANPIILDLKEGYKLDDFIAEFGINALKELMEKARDAKTNNIQPTNGAEGRLETSTISSSS